ncbi:MAG: sigma-54-dependent Fis family transcriptional regulator, partial [Planctomycetes bacterium]|nr:sigma-54-dependent Fis family transcriptional regulator [Planctomycetota bacterium]
MSETSFILIVENDARHAEALENKLRPVYRACRVAASRQEALDSLRTRRPDVIVIDDLAENGDPNADRLVEETSRTAPDAQIVLLTPSADRASGVKARYGPSVSVLTYDDKPVDLDRLGELVATAVRQARRNRESRALAEQSERATEFEGIITVNPVMLRIVNMVRRVADSKLTVLILGESGTGKELVATAIHTHSPRSNRAYRAINCAGLHENLLESLLFGHVRGAFTGAVADHRGLFEVVDGGTLFLDEVGDMPLPMQAKLLRTLENGEIQPVGSNELRRVDVRVVAATRQDVRAMVEKGQFRDDLFYRLNQVTLRLPSLRERREDIPLLISRFIRQACETHNKTVTAISPEAVRRLTSQHWPGNVRELRSVIDQMVVLADKLELNVEDLPEHVRGSTDIV